MSALQRLWLRLWRAMIWHPLAIPRDAAYIYVSPLKRAFLPAYDIAIAWLGLAGLYQGFQSVSAVFPDPVAVALYAGLTLSGIACFFGCAFPRLWRVEVGGKYLIITILTALAITMVIGGLTIRGHTGITVTPLIIICTFPPLIRLWTMGREYGNRKARTHPIPEAA